MSYPLQQMKKKVIIIESSEEAARESAAAIASVPGMEIALLSPSMKYVLEKAKEIQPDLVVVDESVKGLPIHQFSAEMRKVLPYAQIVITTTNQGVDFVRLAQEHGADAVLPKPLFQLNQSLAEILRQTKPSPAYGYEFENNVIQFQQNQWPNQEARTGYNSAPFPQADFSQPPQMPQGMMPPQGGFAPQPPLMNFNPMPGGMGYVQPFPHAPHPYQGAMPVTRPKIVVTVYSPKGGVGKTMLSLNIAVAIRQLSKKHFGEVNALRVGLVDFDVDFGDVAASLQLVPHGSVTDWPKEDEPDLGYVQNLFTYHQPSGVMILAGPDRPELEFMLNQEQAERVINGMHSLFDVTVVDMGYALRKSSLMAMSKATHLLFVTTPDTPATRDMTRAKKSLEEHNIDFSRAGLVINKIPKKGKPPLSIQEVGRYAGIPIAAQIPEDPCVLEALSDGTPLMFKGNKSSASAEIQKLAEIILGPQYLQSFEGAGKSKRRGFSFLKRGTR